jgi:hypothetical protein
MSDHKANSTPCPVRGGEACRSITDHAGPLHSTRAGYRVADIMTSYLAALMSRLHQPHGRTRISLALPDLAHAPVR